MEHQAFNYEVRYLLDGEEHTAYLEATSAAAAMEAVRHEVDGGNTDFELIQVQVVDDSAEPATTE